VVAVTSVSRDVTKELEAAEALQESEERYHRLADSTFEGIVLHDNGIIVDANKRIVELAGYTREELIGMNFFELLDEDSQAMVRERIQVNDERPFEVNAFAKDGSPLELEVLGKVIPYKGSTLRVASVRDIGERKAAEAALRRSEERYRLLAENVHDVIWTMDMDLNYTYVSPSVEQQRGYRPEEFLQQSIKDVMTPESLARVMKVVDQVLMPILAGEGDPQTSVTLELEMYRKDGMTILTEMSISLMLDEESVPLGILGVTRDITERKAVEEAMDRSESRYRLLAENVEDIIFTLGNDLTFNYVSPSFVRLTGYSVEELIEMGWQGLFAPEALEIIMESVAEDVFGIMEGAKEPHKSSILVEAELRKRDGTICWVEVNVSTILDDAGNIKEMLGVARDITDRREAASALVESEERYRLLAENVADIIFVMGVDLTFDYVSPSFEKLTGYTTDQLRDMGWQDMLTPDSLEVAMSLVAEKMIEAMKDGTAPQTSVILEMEIITKDEDTIWTEVNLSIIHDPEGEVRGILGVARDVSERKVTQERFIEEKKRAELYLDLFGHDIRNINQGIMSYLELMLMRPGIEPETADYIKSVLEQATRINDLVAKVQRLTQLRVRQIPIEDVDAQSFIHAAIDYVNAKYSDRDLRVEVRSSCTVHTVRGSKLLTDVFISILDNAIRFNRNETVEVDISCRPSEDGGSIQFIFDDRGPGIADGTKDKVFRRLEQPDGDIKGSGLGLTVVWEIIKQLEGRIWVEDRVYGDPTQGSRFVVELPRGAE
jgi:PAS domain S-box-containing protein